MWQSGETTAEWRRESYDIDKRIQGKEKECRLYEEVTQRQKHEEHVNDQRVNHV